MAGIGKFSSPDAATAGLLAGTVDPLRYNSTIADPHEVPGIMHSLMPAGVRVLDIGCGTGSVTAVVNGGKGNRVVGVEPDADRAESCRKNGLEVHCQFADEQFFADQAKFDVITMADVLEHTVNPASLLQLARKGLVDNGIIIASVPNVAHWIVRLRLLLGQFDYKESGIMDATHLRWFTQRSFVALFERCGLEVVELKAAAGTWMYPKMVPAALIVALNRLLPTVMGSQFVILAKEKPAA
jgi:methionine biosynthesis protein MetW